MKIKQIKEENIISFLNYKSGIKDTLKETLKSMEKLIDDIYQQMNAFSKANSQEELQNLNPGKIKKILKDIIKSRNFLKDIGKMDEKNNIKQLVS